MQLKNTICILKLLLFRKNRKLHFLFFIFFLFQIVHISCSTKKTNINSSISFFSEKKKTDNIIDTVRDDYFQKDYFRYDDYVYNKNIKSVELKLLGFKLSDPVLELGSQEKLVLSFDDLSGGYCSYMYSFIYCDANWKPIDIPFSEYCEGFTENYVKEYYFSLNTIQKYTHYKVVFPNNNINFTKSGNYLIIVYPENEKNNIVLSRRFCIVEKLITIHGEVKKTLEVENMNEKQQITFKLIQNMYKIQYPEKLKVKIIQNNRKDNLIENLKPRFVLGNELVYDWDFNNSFNGGNEWRYFDIRSLKVNSERVMSIDFYNNEYHVYLQPDENRKYKNYYTYEDINGRHLIKTYDAENSDIESEYVWVHFTLPSTAPNIEGNLYIFGSLTDYSIKSEAKLDYDYEHSRYTGKLYLKQGYYNYFYVLMRDEKYIADETYIEGNHSETSNEYKIIVYYREPGQLYDRIIGYTII